MIRLLVVDKLKVGTEMILLCLVVCIVLRYHFSLSTPKQTNYSHFLVRA